jgi:hypothetical protein
MPQIRAAEEQEARGQRHGGENGDNDEGFAEVYSLQDEPLNAVVCAVRM